MTTHDQSGAAPIGVIGLPAFASLCAQIGLRPIYFEDNNATVAAIQETLAAGAFPVIVSEPELPGLWHWVQSFSEQTPAVVVLAPDDYTPDDVLTHSALKVLSLPTTVGNVLSAAGFSGIHEQIANIAIDGQGNVDSPFGPAPAAQSQPATEPAPADPAPAHTQPAATDPASTPVTPAVPAQPAPAPPAAPAVSLSAALSASENPAPRRRATRPVPPKQGHCIVTWSGKGGVGKSTFAFALAQRAALTGGLSVCLVDANIGQGDLRTILRVGSSGLPSIYQAALSGDPWACVITPDTLNESRPIKLEPLAFSVVQAPPPHVPNPDLVTPELYLDVVRYARATNDLVIVDTQIVESIDRYGMVDNFTAPIMMSPNTWGCAISDFSSPSIVNLLTRLKVFTQVGIPAKTQLSTLNRVPRIAENEIPGIAGALSEHSTFLGCIFDDDNVPEHMNRGRPIGHLTEFSSVLDALLLRVTGDSSKFGPEAQTVESAQAAAKKGGSRFGGLFGRGR